MSNALMADLRDHVVNLNIAGASKASVFATYATNKLHVAMRCAEQPKPDEESLRRMAAALNCIGKRAAAKGIARSDIVIAEGKPKRSENRNFPHSARKTFGAASRTEEAGGAGAKSPALPIGQNI